MRDDDDDLTVGELRELAALPRDTVPPAELEERVVAALRQRGALRAGTAKWRAAALAAGLLAAAALVFLAGLEVGAGRARAVRPTFALLVYDTPGDTAGEDLAAAVAEAGAWAAGLREQGVLVSGEKLVEEATLLAARDGRVERVRGASSTLPVGTLGGFFLIEAEDRERAESLAATCPLLERGRRIAVRAVAAGPPSAPGPPR